MASEYNTELANKYKALAIECKKALQFHEIKLESRVVDSKNIGTFYKYVNKKLPSGIVGQIDRQLTN